jgi:hypothetical protein
VFGSALVEAGLSVELIKEWSRDPAVDFNGGKFSVFDLHEDLNYEDCIAKSLAIVAGSTPVEPPEEDGTMVAPGSPGGSGLAAARALGAGDQSEE